MARQRIAIIDDNDDNRFVLRTYLQDHNDVIEFSEGQEALRSMKKDIPDLVFLDISLPGMDGIDVLEQIRADARLAHLPVFAVTAHAMSGDRERFLRAGFDGYISKPIDLAKISQAVERSKLRYHQQAC
ncbi:MAG TPA: response regulator [Terriglobia bacterium]|nr:response regulator [Terriglobia bacterium]